MKLTNTYNSNMKKTAKLYLDFQNLLIILEESTRSFQMKQAGRFKLPFRPFSEGKDFWLTEMFSYLFFFNFQNNTRFNDH